jgi:adenylate cyclase
VLLVLTVFADNPLVRGLETASLDLRFRLRGARPPGSQVAVILVDDRTLEDLGRWPLSRALFARALAMLDQAGAKVVAFDLLFTEPDEPVPADLREAARGAAEALAGEHSERLRRALERLADSDRDKRFAAAMRASGHVLLPIGLSFVATQGDEPAWLSQSAYARFERSELPPVFPLRPKSAVLPIEILAVAAAGLGHVTIAYDRDGAPRYDYVALPFEADFLPSLSIRAAAAYLGVAWPEVALALGAGLRIGDLIVPTDRAMRLLINYRGPRDTFPSFSFADLLAGRVTADQLTGRIVLIGASFAGSSDNFAQPFGNTPMPGVERMANIIDTIINRNFIGEPSRNWNIVMTAAILLAAALAGAMTEFLPTRFAALAAATPIATWAGAAQLAFAKNVWLPVVVPTAALATAAATVLLFRYWVVDRDGRRIRTAFRQYLAPEMVAELAAHPERLRLGGEVRPMTILFCDIRSFTTLAEGMDARTLTSFLNSFLSPMTEIITAQKGTIDRYLGDGIMAFWNAPLDDPDHAKNAVGAAQAMRRKLVELNRGWEAEAKASEIIFRPVRMGIGINTGECCVGNYGSQQHFNYSLLGDPVNLASRLESLSKVYGIDLVIGEETAARLSDPQLIEIDLVAVKGKTQAVRVYTLPSERIEEEQLFVRHSALLKAYRRQDWAGARAAIAECRQYDAPLAQLYDVYDERIGFFVANPPGPDWDGVFVAGENNAGEGGGCPSAGPRSRLLRHF